MEATIEVSGLRKRFGPVLALDGMSFGVTPGQVTGFVGPNGAGKSTTMRVILGLAAAGHGELTVAGLEPGKVVALLGEGGIPFSEVAAHRVSLEAAYLELTRDAVEFRAEAGEARR